jgi:hypothetical protein
MFLKNFKNWLQAIKGERSPNSFWYHLNKENFSSYLDTPWGHTQQKFYEYSFWIDDGTTYSEWIVNHFWDEYDGYYNPDFQ